MPWVSSRPTGQQDGSIITQFTNTTGTSFVTYNYPSSQSSIIIENKSLNDIFVNVGNVTNQLIKSYTKWKYEGSFDSFSIRSDVNSQEFTATAMYKELQDFSQINGKMNDLETKVNTATTTLAEKVSKVNGTSPDANGNVTLPIPQVDTSNLATKNELNALGQLKFIGVYATVTALQTAYPTGTNGIALVSADGYGYYWNGTAWTKGALFQSTGIGDGTVTLTKLDNRLVENITKYKQMVYVVENGYYHKDTGVFNAGVNWASIKSPCLPNDKLRVTVTIDSSSMAMAVFYNSSGTRISSINPGLNGRSDVYKDYEFTVPSNAYYVSISGKSSPYEIKLERLEIDAIVERLNAIDNNIESPATVNLTNTHRILLVEPSGNNYDHSIGGEDAFRGGLLVECCSWEGLVINADEWKNEFDVIVIFDMYIRHPSKVTLLEAKNVMQKFKDTGKKLVILAGSGLKLRKYEANATYTELDIGMDILSGLSLYTANDFSAGTGSFQHGTNYPFSTEIIRPGITAPTHGNIGSYQSTDPLTVFPIKAVQDAKVSNFTAYKPGKFFVMNYGGAITGNAAVAPLWKFLMLDKVISALIGKTVDVRMGLDAQNGKKIAAGGFDGDATTDTVAVDALVEAIGSKRPIGLSLYATKITPELAGYYRSLPGRVSLLSHTNDHFNLLSTITDEVHTVGSDQLIKLKRPYRAQISSVKSIDNVTTFTFQAGDVGVQSPTGNNYFVDYITTSPIEAKFGLLKFAPDKIGAQVKVSYVCIENEYREIVGSIDTLEKNGCITDKAVYMTGGVNGTHPYTALMAEKKGIILCSHGNGPEYNRANFYARIRKDKFPIPVASLFKIDASDVVRDTTLFLYSKDYVKSTLLPKAIAYCKTYDLPFEWYDHDFMCSQTDGSSVWANTTNRWDSDWKKPTYTETKAYAAEMYKYLYDTLDAEGVHWMPREDACRRIDYLNRHIAYDVKDLGSGKIRISVVNNGSSKMDGLTFRVPLASTPTKVVRLRNIALPYKYENGVCTLWFDLASGASAVIEVS